jgi:hypothetical protein
MNRTLAFLGALLLVSACSSGTSDDGGATTGGATSGATSTGGTTTGSVMPVARIRVAALSPDTQAFDYCFAPTGTQNFIGPIMSGRSAYGGLAFPSTSDYSSLTPGTYDLAFVPPGSLDCTLPKSDAGYSPTTTLPALAGSTSYTVAMTGPHSALSISTLTDDTSTTAAASLRFISAKLGSPGLDMAVNGATTATFSNVTYATVPAMTSNITANGYAGLANAGATTLAFAAHGSSSSLLVATGITFTSNSYNSVFTIPPPAGYSGTLSAFVCFDSLPPSQGLSTCIAFPVP